MSDKIKVWLDCDPGHDDMFAIILAALSEEINLIGISTSVGNSTVENTTQNALNVLEEINRNDILVYQGSSHPLVEEINTADSIHGVSGLEGAVLKKSSRKPITTNSLWEVFNVIQNQDGQVHFVVTGAMTNLAILIKAFPTILDKLSGITIMGGAIGLGNWSPAAEFNIYVDPEAAHIVFNCGVKVNMIPLDLTHTVQMNEKVFEEVKEINTDFSKKVYDLFRYFQKSYKQSQDFDFPPVHDPCTIYYLLNPNKFTGRDCFVEIELAGKSRGRTNCTFMHYKKANCFVCEKVDVGHFWELMVKVLKKII